MNCFWYHCYQEEVKQELEYQATDKTGTGKRKTLTIYCKPYFKDVNGSVSISVAHFSFYTIYC
jgi:hypothetical protein